jgi:hypothetical protein
MDETLVKAVAGAVLGLVVGWGGNALTLSGRVSAIEASLVRIEARLYGAAPAPAQEVARK